MPNSKFSLRGDCDRRFESSLGSRPDQELSWKDFGGVSQSRECMINASAVRSLGAVPYLFLECQALHVFVQMVLILTLDTRVTEQAMYFCIHS